MREYMRRKRAAQRALTKANGLALDPPVVPSPEPEEERFLARVTNLLPCLASPPALGHNAPQTHQRPRQGQRGHVYGANDESPASAMTTGLSVSPWHSWEPRE
jgi:hypothetical protein